MAISEFLRILIALLLLHMQQIRGVGHGPFRFIPHRNPTLSATLAPTPTATAIVPASATQVPTFTETPVPSSTPTPRPSATSSPIPPSVTPTETPYPSASASATATSTPPPTSTASAIPTATSTATPVPPTWTPTATATNTAHPTATAPAAATATSAQISDPTGADVAGIPPAQKLPSAVLIYPLVRSSATQDTRVEMLNLLGAAVSVQCFYVSGGTCNEIGFLVSLTPNQPLSWMASSGVTGNGRHVAPPFTGDGELKCAVVPPNAVADPTSYNALQGRALISDSTGQTIGYSAIAFRRLSPGSFTGQVSLDGINYEKCPDRLHFNVLTNQSGSDSTLVLVPCSENLVTQQPSGANVQIAVINEMEQRFSGATRVTCFNRINFSSVSALRKSAIGTDTAHLILRGTDVPVIGLVIDRFTTGSGQLSTSSNEPYLEGGRSASIELP